MPARVDGLALPHHPFRWFLSVALGSAFLATVIATLRRRVLKPSVARMSEQWLVSHEKEFNRLDY
jgi:hypothetical protein